MRDLKIFRQKGSEWENICVFWRQDYSEQQCADHTLLYWVCIHMKIKYPVTQPKQPSRYVRAPTLSASSKIPLMWFTVCSNWLRSS